MIKLIKSGTINKLHEATKFFEHMASGRKPNTAERLIEAGYSRKRAHKHMRGKAESEAKSKAFYKKLHE